LAATAKSKTRGIDEQTLSYNLNNQRQRLSTWADAPASIWTYQKVSTAIIPDGKKKVARMTLKDLFQMAYIGHVTRRRLALGANTKERILHANNFNVLRYSDFNVLLR
jgi:hypothetical protein